MVRVTRTVPPPADYAGIMARVEDEVELDLSLESVMEGVWISGTGTTTISAECARCLEPTSWSFTFPIEELFAYPATDARGAVVAPEGEPDEGEYQVQGDVCDLEDVVRDAIVPEFPLAPLCSPDCLGLCPECGIRLAEDPTHGHEVLDPRWAALDALRDREQ